MKPPHTSEHGLEDLIVAALTGTGVAAPDLRCLPDIGGHALTTVIQNSIAVFLSEPKLKSGG